MSKGFWRGFFTMWRDEDPEYRPLIGNTEEAIKNRGNVLDHLLNSEDVEEAALELVAMGYRQGELHPYVSAVS